MTVKLPTQPLCRCCGRRIKKVTWRLFFGCREARDDGWSKNFVERPMTKADAERFTNHQIVSIDRNPIGADDFVRSATTWDGETYADEFFCTNRCAMTFAYSPDEAAAAIGIARQGISDFERMANVLATINIGRDDAVRLLAPIYQKEAKDKADVDALVGDFDAKANRTVNGIMEAALKGAGAIDGTAWGLLNGATYYANHTAKGSAGDRFASTTLGSNNLKLNQLASSLMELA